MIWSERWCPGAVMKSYNVDLEQMLMARERRAEIQNKMLAGARNGQCLVCLTMNIAGDVKRTPMTRMLFDHGIELMESIGFSVRDKMLLDEVTGSEAFWLFDEEGEPVKYMLEAIEEAFPAARLYDFDVILPDGGKLSRDVARRCLICDEPAAECARSRRHGLEAVRKATDSLLKDFCAKKLAEEAHDALLKEVYTTPKPGLVDLNNNGAHSDMDVMMFERSANALAPYFKDAARLGMEGCGISDLRERGIRAEKEMFDATGGVNTHKGLIYSMGLLIAGMGRCLAEGSPHADHVRSCVGYAAALASEDAEIQLEKSLAAPSTNGGAVYKKYGARGATGEAAAGFPDALYCLGRLSFYMKNGCKTPGVMALCDCMARLEDTNLLHRGGKEGLEYVRQAAAAVSDLPVDERIGALQVLDADLIARDLSPGGSADMLAIAILLQRWQTIGAALFTDEREDE